MAVDSRRRRQLSAPGFTGSKRLYMRAENSQEGAYCLTPRDFSVSAEDF